MAATDNDSPKLYAYEAVSPNGTRVKGSKARMSAYSEDAVRRELLGQGFIPLEIREVRSAGWNVDFSQMAGNRPLKLKAGEISAFARQLHQLLAAGISIPKAIAALGEDAPDPRLTRMCLDMATKVQSGAPLSVAFAEYPETFDEVFCAYIAAGEETGSLVETTKRLAKMKEKEAALALKLKSVTAYPKMVSIAIAFLVLGILLFLVPNFAKIYADFGAELPAPTQALVRLSNNIPPVKMDTVGAEAVPFIGRFIPKPWTIRPNVFSPLLHIFLIRFAIRRFVAAKDNDPEWGRRLDRIKYRMPIFGQLNHKMALFRWTSTLAGGLESGVQTSNALDLSARASGSRWIKAVTPDMVEALRTGRPLSAVLVDEPELFPANIRTMVVTGEQAGELGEMVGNSANAMDDEIDALVAGLGAKIEVALLMVLGGVVGTLLVILYLPILNLTTAVGEGLDKQEGG